MRGVDEKPNVSNDLALISSSRDTIATFSDFVQIEVGAASRQYLEA
jgi:hypothetical protein